ncbi:MAG: His/Gly/Thr/Pro-type tRNA ligase C-terminal domain-containing protein, partial [Chloroflexota bacterium]|nr:His/Gly/Thr/Pro-type tRNA ligase C-terminal domain-containing protein [Chloroflexota bacterium]
VGLDRQEGDMRTRIKEATERKAVYILVVGDKEAAARQVSVRRRGSRDEERAVPLDAIAERLVAERDDKRLPADFVRPEGAPTLMADA